MILFLLILTLGLNLFIPSLLPQWNLFYFAPFLIITYYKKPLPWCLGVSLCCGCLLDLLAGQNRLGLYALNYCVTTVLLYHQKRNFFEDSISTIPLMTFFFSLFSTLFQIGLLYIFEKGVPLSWELVWTDFVLLPLMDAAYGFFVFALPLFFLTPRKRGEDYFLVK